jgi:hypothetical protein
MKMLLFLLGVVMMTVTAADIKIEEVKNPETPEEAVEEAAGEVKEEEPSSGEESIEKAAEEVGEVPGLDDEKMADEESSAIGEAVAKAPALEETIDPRDSELADSDEFETMKAYDSYMNGLGASSKEPTPESEVEERGKRA